MVTPEKTKAGALEHPSTAIPFGSLIQSLQPDKAMTMKGARSRPATVPATPVQPVQSPVQ